MADRDPCETLDKLAQAIDIRVGKVIWDVLGQLRDELKAQEPLKKRTRGMPYVRRPIQMQGDILIAEVYAPPKWAEVFIGTGSTTIVPKRHEFLAIPTSFIESFRGTKESIKQYAGTLIFGGIIWGKAGWAGLPGRGGIRQHKAAGEKIGRQTLIPLFILKKSVVLQKRIDPAQWVAEYQPILNERLKKVIKTDDL